MNSAKKTAGPALFLAICAFAFTFPLAAESPGGAESAVGEESFAGEILPVGEELILIYEGLLSDEEYLLSEDFFTGETPVKDDEVIEKTGESFFIDEEPFFIDEEEFFFEGPTIIIEASPVYENRSFDDIFPNLSQSQRIIAFGKEGLKHSFEKDSSPMLIPQPDSGIDLLGSVMEKNPSHIIETLVVVPYSDRELDMLDVYNALGKIENIQDHTLLLNGNDVKIFSETTRIDNARNRNPIPDPPPADMLPFSETMYLRFRDAYMGNLFLRGDLSVSLYGVTYTMTNFTDIRYFIVPIMRAERFTAIIYLEPVKEGVLVYSMS